MKTHMIRILVGTLAGVWGLTAQSSETIAYWSFGTYIYSCYYTSDEAARTPNFIVYDKDFKVVGKHLFGWTHGVDVSGSRSRCRDEWFV